MLARFDNDDAWRLGLLLVDLARQRGAPVTVDIRRGGHQLFHYALPGTTADNDSWIERKSNVVARFGDSSYLVGAKGRLAGRSLRDRGMDPLHHADHGGSFPIIIAGVGAVGAVTVSGGKLPTVRRGPVHRGPQVADGPLGLRGRPQRGRGLAW